MRIKKAPCEEHGAGCLEDTPDGDDFGEGGGAYADSVFGGCGMYDSAVAHVDGYVTGVEKKVAGKCLVEGIDGVAGASLAGAGKFYVKVCVDALNEA